MSEDEGEFYDKDAPRRKFISFVISRIAAHPEWMADTVLALQAGVNESLRRETEARGRAEVALTIAVSAINEKKILKNQLPLVWQACADTLMFHGSIYADEMAKKVLAAKE